MSFRFLLPMTLALLWACSSPEAEPEPEARANPVCERVSSAPRCAPEGFEQCSPSAAADEVIVIGGPMSLAEPPYGIADCPGRFLYEVDTRNFTPSQPIAPSAPPLWLTTVWDITKIDTPEKCAQIVIDVAVQRQLSGGTWQDWDAFRVLGDWTYLEACETVMCGGGKLPDGTLNNTTGAPHTWVDVENTHRVRVAVGAYDGSCHQDEVLFAARETE